MGAAIAYGLIVFAVLCVFYGIAEGVGRVQRGAGRVWAYVRPHPQPAPLPAANPSSNCSTTAQRCLGELEDLYRLRQKGVLSDAEFEQLKRHILASISSNT